MSDAQGAPPEFVIERTFDAPRDVVWRAWTEPALLAQWLGPAGCEMRMLRHCMRPGGVVHFQMTMPDAEPYYGRFEVEEVDAPHRLRWRHMFADAAGAPARNPWDPTWPLMLATTVTLTEDGERTRVRLTWAPIEAIEAERASFEAGLASCRQGWSGSFAALDGLLPDVDADTRSAGHLRMRKDDGRSLELVRHFAAPPEAVFRAFTEPDLIRVWMLGPDDKWTMPVCTVDLRPGGRSRYVWKADTGEEMGVTGTFVEVDPPRRLVHDEIFDEDWYDGPARITTEFAPTAGGTRVTMTIRYRTAIARDRVFSTPMIRGMEAGYRKLDRRLGAPRTAAA